MRLALAKTGPAVASPPFLRAVLAVDLLAALGGIAWGAAGIDTDGPFRSPGLALAAYGIAVFVADLYAARLSPRGLTWRRRLCYLAIVAVVWRNGPFASLALAVPVILWSGVVWVALVTGGRALSRAIAAATGEDKPE